MESSGANSSHAIIHPRLEQLPQRVLSKLKLSSSGCWLWTSNIINSGYGTLTTGSRRDCSRRTELIHRFVYEQLVGKIPPGMQIDHICEIKHCVNPKHLRLVTHRFNTLRSDTISGLNSRKTHCPRGHSYDLIKNNGQRSCSICHRNEERERAARKRHARKIP